MATAKGRPEAPEVGEAKKGPPWHLRGMQLGQHLRSQTSGSQNCEIIVSVVFSHRVGGHVLLQSRETNTGNIRTDIIDTVGQSQTVNFQSITTQVGTLVVIWGILDLGCG